MTTIKDPFGAILILIRDDPTVAGIVSGKVSDLVEDPPSVFIEDIDDSLTPFGTDSGRIGVQFWNGIARCYGTDDETGAILARQLAGAVAGVIHNHGPIRVGATQVYRMKADIAGRFRDPDTHWPYYDVRIEAYAATQAVA